MPIVLILNIWVANAEIRANARVTLRSLVAPLKIGISSRSCSCSSKKPMVPNPGIRLLQLATSINKKNVIKYGKIFAVRFAAIDSVKL